MKVRYLKSMLNPEEYAGPVGCIRDIPAGEWLDRLLKHHYVESTEPVAGEPVVPPAAVLHRMVDELSGMQEWIGRAAVAAANPVLDAVIPVRPDDPDEDDEEVEDEE